VPASGFFLKRFLSVLRVENKSPLPLLETSEAETMVRIKDGVTVVIGGLIKDEQSDIHRKFPVLGSIPVLGTAFPAAVHRR